MKSIILALAILATALAVPAKQSSEGSSVHNYDGTINFDAYGESTMKHTLEGLFRAAQEALQNFGGQGSINNEANARGQGQVQGNLNFAGTRTRGNKQGQPLVVTTDITKN